MNAHGKFLDQIADWPYLTAVPAALQEGQFSPVTFRQVLDQGTELLKERFVADEPIEDLPYEHIPIAKLLANHAQLNAQHRYLMICASGKRSLAAAEHLREHGFGQTYSLKGGLAQSKKD